MKSKSGKPIITIDASLLGESDCSRKIDFILNEEISGISTMFKMDYGTAFHKFRALYRQGYSTPISRKAALDYFLPKCLEVPEDDFRTIDHLAQTTLAYADYYPHNIDILRTFRTRDGEPWIELPFCFPWASTTDYDCVLMGTVDELAIWDNRLVICDAKVTAVWDKVKFLESFDLDPQLRFYSWVLKKFGITSKYIPALIDGVFIRRPTEKSRDKLTGKLVKNIDWNGASFQRSNGLMEYSDRSMVEFEEWVRDKIDTIINNTLNKKWPPNFNCCTTLYGPCDYHMICKGLLTKEYFKKRTYNPLQFQA